MRETHPRYKPCPWALERVKVIKASAPVWLGGYKYRARTTYDTVQAFCSSWPLGGDGALGSAGEGKPIESRITRTYRDYILYLYLWALTPKCKVDKTRVDFSIMFGREFWAPKEFEKTK